MSNEVPRNPKRQSFISPVTQQVNPEIQKVLDDVNKVMDKAGYALQPVTNFRRGTPRIIRFLIRKWSKYLVSSFVLRKLPEKPKNSREKRK